MTIDLEAVRASLKERQAELLERLDKVSRKTRHREEPLSADFAEQAVELENQGVLEALDQGLEEELTQIARAIERIDQEEYDICSKCGDEISPARLGAVPYATTCLRCATAAEAG